MSAKSGSQSEASNIAQSRKENHHKLHPMLGTVGNQGSVVRKGENEKGRKEDEVKAYEEGGAGVSQPSHRPVKPALFLKGRSPSSRYERQTGAKGNSERAKVAGEKVCATKDYRSPKSRSNDRYLNPYELASPIEFYQSEDYENIDKPNESEWGQKE